MSAKPNYAVTKFSTIAELCRALPAPQFLNKGDLIALIEQAYALGKGDAVTTPIVAQAEPPTLPAPKRRRK